MSFEIKSHTVYYSTFNKYENHDCTICRQSLNEDSIYAKEENYFSKVITGSCGHSFHAECLKPWLEKYNKCPICATHNAFDLIKLNHLI